MAATNTEFSKRDDSTDSDDISLEERKMTAKKINSHMAAKNIELSKRDDDDSDDSDDIEESE